MEEIKNTVAVVTTTENLNTTTETSKVKKSSDQCRSLEAIIQIINFNMGRKGFAQLPEVINFVKFLTELSAKEQQVGSNSKLFEGYQKFCKKYNLNSTEEGFEGFKKSHGVNF